MNATRWILLLSIGLIVFLMVGIPGFHHTAGMRDAVRNHAASPSEETKKQLEEVKRVQREEVRKFEWVMAGLLVLCTWGFVRAGKKAGSGVSRKDGPSGPGG